MSWLAKGGQGRLTFEPWDDGIVDNPWASTGIGGRTIRRLRDLESNGLVCLGWRRYELVKCVDSMVLLSYALWPVLVGQYEMARPNNAGLQVDINEITRGYRVAANFDPVVWDVIEHAGFKGLLPAINTHIRHWFEEFADGREDGQYTTVFNGKDGPTLMFYPPSTSRGVWISGSREPGIDGHQLYDHNTDGALDVMGHLVALCTVLDHCRKAIDSGILSTDGA
ncbi:MAG: hypothetical protein WC773_00390 [Patescibacteria group bacterium]